MGSDYIHLKLAAAVGFVLVACCILFDWASKEKRKTDKPDEKFSWTLIQVIAILVGVTFIGVFILVLAILDAISRGGL